MAKTPELTVGQDACLEILNLVTGVFDPLKGFLNSSDYKSVVENMHLTDGAPWTIPITLDIPEEVARGVMRSDTVVLKNEGGSAIAELTVEDVYKVNFENDIKKIFGTEESAHPGVAKEITRSLFRIGGPIRLLGYADPLFPEHSLIPAQTRKIFKEKGWKTVAGFQTRNAIHRAHEYLQRIALEVTDGLFIQPLIGWKKAGDMSSLAIVRSYEMMVKDFYSPDRVVLGLLKTPMRYAGPREAVFHALIRRNFGCTHFIVGRDHAGVGDYYGKYEAQDLCGTFNDLGIQILKLSGPYYCEKCAMVVTEKTCAHGDAHSVSISGTYMRSQFSKGESPPPHLMREEIAGILLDLAKKKQLFNAD